MSKAKAAGTAKKIVKREERSPSPPAEVEFINGLPYPQFLEALKMYRAQRKAVRKHAAAKEVTFKRCNQCCLTLRLEQFSLKEDGKYGRSGICKLCKKSKNSEYYKKQKKT